jgi:hypothetical protein
MFKPGDILPVAALARHWINARACPGDDTLAAEAAAVGKFPV